MPPNLSTLRMYPCFVARGPVSAAHENPTAGGTPASQWHARPHAALSPKDEAPARRQEVDATRKLRGDDSRRIVSRAVTDDEGGYASLAHERAHPAHRFGIRTHEVEAAHERYDRLCRSMPVAPGDEGRASLPAPLSPMPCGSKKTPGRTSLMRSALTRTMRLAWRSREPGAMPM